MDEISWQRVKRGLLGKHPHARVVGREIRMILLFFGDTRVGIRIRAHGPQVQLLAEIACTERIEPLDALRWNVELGAGAIALIGRTYVMTCVVDDVDVDRLEHRLQTTAGAAARIRRTIEPAAAPVACALAFAGLAD